jgi:glycogen synthase
MRILTIGNLYPPHSLGGYEVVWESAVGFLTSQRGHEVRVLATSQIFGEVAVEDGPEVERVLHWYWRDGEWPRLSIRQRLSIEKHNLRCLEQTLSDFRPDAVSWWGMGGMSLSLIEATRRKRIPMVFAVCDDWLLYAPEVDAYQRVIRRMRIPKSLSEHVTRIPAELKLENAGTYLFPSKTVCVRARAAGWNLERTAVCHQGVSKELFPRRKDRKGWNGELLYVGRVEERKGVDLAIKAIARLPGERLRIIGPGDAAYVLGLRALVSELRVDGRVSFEQMPRRELPDAYSSADALLFPVRWQEPWGLVPLEAMAVGVPVIATGRGGSGEYLSDGKNCLMIDPDEGDEPLAASIKRLAVDPLLRRQLIEAGFETTGRFGEDDFSQAVAGLIEEAGS